ncbi:MAG: tripartite tricarboxylate transporter TctB family protein, partial [Thiohalocapsa sp.]
AWAALFMGGGGFVLPTFIMQAALLRVGGMRRPAAIVAVSTAVTAAAYLLFVALLDIPLPNSLLPDSLQGF